MDLMNTQSWTLDKENAEENGYAVVAGKKKLVSLASI